jgi:hypothetical protein
LGIELWNRRKKSKAASDDVLSFGSKY